MSTKDSAPIPSLPMLPLPVVARILSYNVASTRDAAELRLIGKSAGETALGLLAGMASSSRGGHWISCPQIRCEGDSYAEKLVEVDHQSEELMFSSVGDCMEGVHVSFFDACGDVQIIGKPEDYGEDEFKSKTHPSARTEEEIYQKLHDICAGMKGVETFERLRELYVEAEGHGLLDPIEGQGERDITELDDDEEGPAFVFSSFLTLDLSSVQKCVHRELAFGDEKRGYVLQTNEALVNTFEPLKSGKSYRAVSISPEKVHVLIKLVIGREDLSWLEDNHFISSLRLDELLMSSYHHEVVEGVAISHGAVPRALRALLQKNVEALARKQKGSSDGVDYHPNSNGVVRDLVDPSLYSYVKDVSPMSTSPGDILPCRFPYLEETLLERQWVSTGEGRDRVEQKSGEDFWGRQYETSKYQWLPSYFDISDDGRCRIENYINNLVPRNDPVHDALYDSLGSLFEQALPYIESVYTYVQAVRQELRDVDEEVKYNDSPIPALKMKYVSLRGQKLQVITKIVDYELKPGQSYQGVCHVVGMAHEEIVLTCLYILDRDENIDGGEIGYERAFLRREAEYISSTVNQTRQTCLEAMIHCGLVPLGKVQTHMGRLIVFPNLHVHMVHKMVNADAKESGKQRIIIFFLVNPQRRIVSTREVAPQQAHVGGKRSHKEALQDQLELMQERKRTKQDWNDRDFAY